MEKLVRAMIERALARCDRLGIAWEDFDRAMAEEAKIPPRVEVPELIERAFRRLTRAAN